jgi:hypothetical protein
MTRLIHKEQATYVCSRRMPLAEQFTCSRHESDMTDLLLSYP